MVLSIFAIFQKTGETFLFDVAKPTISLFAFNTKSIHTTFIYLLFVFNIEFLKNKQMVKRYTTHHEHLPHWHDIQETKSFECFNLCCEIIRMFAYSIE